MSGSVKSKPGGRFGTAMSVLLELAFRDGSQRSSTTVRNMDDGVLTFMRAMNEGFPTVETMTAPEARAVIESRRLPIENFDDVASADDRLIPSPAGDVPVRVYYPRWESAARPAGVFCHGGGFVLCDLESHDGFCRAMARHTESVVISVDYRLPPEHRAPAAAQDVFRAFLWGV